MKHASVFVVNEGSSVALSLRFLDRYEQEAAPASLTYSVECLTTGAVLVPTTPVADPQAVMELLLPAVVSSIQDEANAYENRRCILEAIGGDGFTTTKGKDWRLKNLSLAP